MTPPRRRLFSTRMTLDRTPSTPIARMAKALDHHNITRNSDHDVLALVTRVHRSSLLVGVPGQHANLILLDSGRPATRAMWPSLHYVH